MGRQNSLEIFLCRHGETEWSLSGQHTGKTDIPLTPRGIDQAQQLAGRLRGDEFTAVWTSPLKRAVETCELAGAENPVRDPDLVEWDYGDYEGLTHAEILKIDPHWNLFLKGAPRGESPRQIGSRADRVIEKARKEGGRILLFSHGHFLRVLAARWIRLEPRAAGNLMLSVASLSVLGFERSEPAIVLWNEHRRDDSV